MSFFELLDGLLNVLDLPHFEGSPEFEDGMPEAFITYSVYDNPVHWGCGREVATRYTVTLSIYTTGADKAANAENISTALDTILTGNGFSRISGNYGFSDEFPNYYRKIADYCYIKVKE